MKVKAQRAVYLLSEVKKNEELIRANNKKKVVGIILSVLSTAVVVAAAFIINEKLFDANVYFLCFVLIAVLVLGMVAISTQQIDLYSEMKKLQESLPPESENAVADVEQFHYDSKIKKFNLWTIINFVCVLLCMISILFVPYVTILGEKISFYSYMKEYDLWFFIKGYNAENYGEMKISQTNLLDAYAKQLYLRYSVVEIDASNQYEYRSWLNYFSFVSTFVCVVMIAYCAFWIVLQFMIKPVKTEMEIDLKTTTFFSPANQLVGNMSMIGFYLVISVVYVDFYRFLKGLSGNLDLGELYSVSPFMIALPTLLIVATIAASVIQQVILSKDKEMQYALLYCWAYRKTAVIYIR